MMKTWSFDEAKNKFSQIVDEAVRSGSQLIIRRGVEAVVVISFEAYRQLSESRGKLSDFLRESPMAGYEIDVTREKSPL